MNRKESTSNMDKPYDLSEESSKRSTKDATEAARHAESDDINEETNIGQVNNTSEDNWLDNKLPTSLDEE